MHLVWLKVDHIEITGPDGPRPWVLQLEDAEHPVAIGLSGTIRDGDTAGTMEWQLVLPAIIGSFVGVMGWLLVGVYIQRRQFTRQARNAAKAVYFELDVNRATIAVAREHGLFSELDRTSFERLLPELATLLAAQELRMVVDAYMTHAGYRQLASQDDLPADVRRAALGTFDLAHDRALATLRARAFTAAETRAIDAMSTERASGAVAQEESVARAKP